MKIILAFVLILIFTFLFTIINVGLDINSVNQIIQPLIFALTAAIGILYFPLRKYFLVVSLCLFSLMVMTYLINMLEVSNRIGSLGFGMLFITVASYLPEIIKKGNIEKF